MNKPPECTHFVFWPYDLYPYVLGAPAFKVKMLDGRAGWDVPSYQMCVRDARVLQVMSLENGKELHDKLDALKEEYRQAERALKNEYGHKLWKLKPLNDAMRDNLPMPGR
jgi:hypothetical protein